MNVHIFPARMNSPDWPKWRDEQIASRAELSLITEQLRASRAELSPLWEQLQRGFDAFEADHRVPKIGVRDNGEYFIRDPR